MAHPNQGATCQFSNGFGASDCVSAINGLGQAAFRFGMLSLELYYICVAELYKFSNINHYFVLQFICFFIQ